MKGMRLLPVILMLLLIGSVCAISLQDCFASHTDNGNEKDETENVYSCVTYTDNDDDDRYDVRDDDGGDNDGGGDDGDDDGGEGDDDDDDGRGDRDKQIM